MRYGQEQGDPFLGRSMGSHADYSPEVASEIDDEVRRLIEAAHTEAWAILNEYRDVLDDLATELLNREQVDPRQIAVNELEILGTRSGGRQCTAEAIRLVADPRWRPIVTDTFPIAEVNAALDHLSSGAALGRIVLTFDA